MISAVRGWILLESPIRTLFLGIELFKGQGYYPTRRISDPVINLFRNRGAIFDIDDSPCLRGALHPEHTDPSIIFGTAATAPFLQYVPTIQIEASAFMYVNATVNQRHCDDICYFQRDRPRLWRQYMHLKTTLYLKHLQPWLLSVSKSELNLKSH
jgi:hypothetical protein